VFRYSYWRDAWILRFIGERWGPVLIARHDSIGPRGLQAPLRRPGLQPPLIEVRSRLTLLAVLGALVAAALGFTIARSSGSGPSSSEPAARASSGVLEVTLPPGWHQQAAPASQPPLPLSDQIALRLANAAGGTLLVGRSAATSSAVVSRSLLATLPRPSSPQPVVLGGAHFTRYLAGAPTQGAGGLEAGYLLPTTVGTVVGLCLASGSDRSFSARCERILGSVRVRAKAPSLALPAGYAESLTTTINGLNVVRASAGAELASARDAQHEMVAANKLAAAHANAAAAILRLNPGPASAASAAVTAALRVTSQSYGSLALAAARADARGYAMAAASVRRANVALQSAFLQLRALGLQVG
jgi:hypothetical protein